MINETSFNKKVRWGGTSLIVTIPKDTQDALSINDGDLCGFNVKVLKRNPKLSSSGNGSSINNGGKQNENG